MGPYADRYWNDVHSQLGGHIADELNERSLPAHYRATMDDRVLMSDLDEPLSGEEYPALAVPELAENAVGRADGRRTSLNGCSSRCWPC